MSERSAEGGRWRAAGRLIFDLLNEPDAWNFTWGQPNINSNGQFANSSTVPAWGDLYTTTAEQLLTQAPSLLLFVEGTGQRNQPGTAYGMGFGINPAIYTNVDGLFNALPGLQTLAGNALVKASTIITPHIYGFQVTSEAPAHRPPLLRPGKPRQEQDLSSVLACRLDDWQHQRRGRRPAVHLLQQFCLPEQRGCAHSGRRPQRDLPHCHRRVWQLVQLLLQRHLQRL